MESGVKLLCFAASYAIALGLELLGLQRRPNWRRWVVVVVTLAGVVAHVWYLGQRAATESDAPLSSRHDWYVASAWLLSVIYLASAIYFPNRAFGLFLLPVVLSLIGASYWAEEEPLAIATSERIWGQLHGTLLMLGTVAVLLGFVAGLMYLIQSNRLKRKRPANSRTRLPSLEWLETINSRSLGAATLLVSLGFFTGVAARLVSRGADGLQWTDSVVVSLGAMTLWLAGAELFRWLYPAARRGRKVAYLTVAALVFLILTLATFTLDDSFHQGAQARAAPSPHGKRPHIATLRSSVTSSRSGGRPWTCG